ncbi:MAG: thioredoxin family protein [Nitrosomonadaceae bacterium]
MVKLVTLLTLVLFAFDAEAGRYHGRKRVKRFFSQATVIGPNTEILVISKSCAPCVKAVAIIKNLQDEGYDVDIVDRKSPLVKKYRVRATPTLIIRELDKKSRKVRGLQSEKKYRELISQ